VPAASYRTKERKFQQFLCDARRQFAGVFDNLTGFRGGEAER
jgi:hypothetical protein